VSYPESAYAVFRHPPYDFAKMEQSVHEALRKVIDSWDPAEHGYAWRDDLPTYQRHNPEDWGQAWVKPMKKIK
jgi:hypothetical protein